MNCREAEKLIFAARDGALEESQRAALVRHVAHCPACQTAQAELEAAAASWRSADAAVEVPTAEAEWHKIRRRIRGGERDVVSGASRWWKPLAWSLSTVTAAALAIVMFVDSSASKSDPLSESRDSSYVSYVKVFNTSDETMIYEDAESGWLVVWVSNDPTATRTSL